MQTSKKKPSVIFLAFGAILAAYLGYLVGGAWEQGIDLMSFMERFNEVCAAPLANYFNENTVKTVAIVVGIYAMAVLMYYTSQRNYMPGKEYGTARFENPQRVNSILMDKDENFNTLTIERKNFEEAKAQFATLEATIHKAFNELGTEIVPLTGNQRLKILHDFYHLGNEEDFDFDIKKAKKVGADFKNDLCNGMIKFFPDSFEDESKFCKALFIKKYPSSLSDRFLNEITSLPVHSITSIDVVPVPKDLTNVDVDNRFVVYGIRDLGTELSPITMLVMMESIQQRIVENGKRGKATWLYIDEFHVLLNSEYSAKYLQQLWKKVRKQGGLCTGITQNVVDLLQNYTATTMLANSEFVALLKQANTDSSKMAEVIGVSDAQLRFVTNSQSGMGLLKCGNVVIPFDNQISKDTSLYKLYNTNLHEIIQEQKAKEKQKNS